MQLFLIGLGLLFFSSSPNCFGEDTGLVATASSEEEAPPISENFQAAQVTEQVPSLESSDLPTATSNSAKLRSPNGKIQLKFKINAKGQPVYSASFSGKEIIGDSALGLEFKNAAPFKGFTILKSWHRSNDSTYSLPVGKTKNARDKNEEYTFEIQEKDAPHRRLQISFKVFDDGIGFQYTIPKQGGISDFIISKENTAFDLKNDPKMLSLDLPFNSTFEGYYSEKKISKLKAGATVTLPLLTSQEKGPWISITEAGLADYAGMYVSRGPNNTLQTELAPSLKDPETKVVGKAPFSSPWRVVMIADSPNQLMESNIVNNLNKPTEISDTSWIHPGKVHFPWFSDYQIPVDPEDKDPTHQRGLNTYTLKKYIDFCAANGIEYHSFDGFDQAWYGGGIGEPSKDADVTKAIPEIDMPEVLRYGREKNVKARIWMHRDVLEHRDIDKIFATYEKWGIEGVMIDFLNRDDQESVKFYSDVIKKAAKHHLTVNFHGSWKSTGLARTYPNLLSHEGVKSTEYNRFMDVTDSKGIVADGEHSVGSPPEHEMNYVWVRQLAGSTDVHPGSFKPVLPKDFKPEIDGLSAMGTMARSLAMYVVVESGSQMVGDNPANYLAKPKEFDFLKKVPVSWDETKVVGGEVGKSITIARRKNQEWWIGSMTDRNPRKMDLPLSFLGKGNFIAEIYADGPKSSTQADDVKITKVRVTSKDNLKLSLAGSGGNAIRIVPESAK